MGIGYGLREEQFPAFNTTAKHPLVDGGNNSIRVGLLSMIGITCDCTSLHINNCSFLFREDANGAASAVALEEVKRYMYYSGKNTAFLTYAAPKGSEYYYEDVEKRCQELGLQIAAVQQGAREHYITKYTLLLCVEPRKIGYTYDNLETFTEDPWYKARPENNHVSTVEKVKQKDKEILNV